MSLSAERRSSERGRQVIAAGILVFATSLLVNAHGLLAISLLPALGAGELNFLFLPLTSLAAGVALIVQFALVRRLPARLARIAIPAVALVSVMLLIQLVSGAPLASGVGIKLLRDVSFVGALVLVSISVHHLLESGLVLTSDVGNWVAVLAGVIFPIAGLVVIGQTFDNRFGGWQLTPTMFANSVVLWCFVAYFAQASKALLTVQAAVAVAVCFLAGTRAALLLLMLLLLFAARREWQFARPTARLLMFLGGVLLLLSVSTLFRESIVALAGQARVVSTEDAERGSLATRAVWIATLFSDLRRDGLLGGMGAGTAEARLGVLPHFDFLRYWYDYSLPAMLLLLATFAQIVRVGSVRLSRRAGMTRLLLVGLALLLLSTHNPLQDAALSVQVAVVLVFSGRLRDEASDDRELRRDESGRGPPTAPEDNK